MALLLIVVSSGWMSAREAAPIFVLDDPRGDDHGNGKLIYPMRDDLHPGDLDLISFSARPEGEGTLFEAVFARKIAPTDRRTIDVGGGSLDTVCRFNFYTLNIDIYVDKDGVDGSGEVMTLPGRLAEIDSANAWEKVICLTPRPFEAAEALQRIMKANAKRQMKAMYGSIDDAKLDLATARLAAEMPSKYFFPTRINVIGPIIRFFVPAMFLGGQAEASWSYVVAVSGADYEQELDVGGILHITEGAAPRLMIIPIAYGTWADRFGGAGEDDYLLPPLVDVIVPEGKKQEAVLNDYDLRSGRPVRLPGVIPAGRGAASQTKPASR
ncbi:MAG: glucodextranase DOMON-like domain-containing protein [Acidobacteriota bacterium]